MKPRSTTTNIKKAVATSGVTGIEPLPAKPVGKVRPPDPREKPLARSRPAPSREEIRKTDHRVMGSRQSLRKLERHNQQRSTPAKGGKKG